MAQLGTEASDFFVPDVQMSPERDALPNNKDDYLAQMKTAGTWGGQPEITAIGKSYQIGIEFRHGQKNLGGRSYDHTKFEAYAPNEYGEGVISQEGAAGNKIRLYYHDNIHFQSLFNCAEDAGLVDSGCSDGAEANDPNPPSAPHPSRPDGAPSRPSRPSRTGPGTDGHGTGLIRSCVM